MRIWFRIALSAFLALAAVQIAIAEERRIALLIGNEDYPAQVGPLALPHEDIERLAISLSGAGFAADDVSIVRDGDQSQMLEAVAAFAAALREAGPDGVGFFYYSGHGGSLESGGVRENYLLPARAEITAADQLPLRGVPLTGVIRSLSTLNSKALFIISDACRNTLPLTSDRSVGGAAGDKGFTPVPMRPGMFIAYSTADGATAPDDGAFAAALARQISRPNQRATRAFELAFREVVQTRENDALPFVSPGLVEDFCFVSCPGETVDATGPVGADAAELDAWRVALREDTREGYLVFAETYPETFLGGEARAMAVLRPTREDRAAAAARSPSGVDPSAEAVSRTVSALEELTASLEGLKRLGGIIDAPESVTDFINNARVYERRGDTLNARRMYERAIAQGVEAVDVHDRYAAILRAQEGLIGAREVYAEIARRQPQNRPVQLTHAGLLPGSARAARLEQLRADDPDFGPVYFELASLYSLDRLGVQTNADKASEERWLRAFFEADASGRVQRWFLDDELLEAWRDTVSTRLAAYDAAPDIDPITFSAMNHNGGWTINVSPTEAAVSILYRLEGEPTFRETAYWDRQDPRTGRPLPMQSINLPLGAPAQAIEVKYVDASGAEQGPFTYMFDPAVGFVANTRQILEMTKTSWVAGRSFDGKYLVYFTHLAGHMCGLSRIEYSFEPDGPLQQEWPLGACNPQRPGALVDGVSIYREIKAPADAARIRVTYRDGTQSEIVTVPLTYFE